MGAGPSLGMVQSNPGASGPVGALIGHLPKGVGEFFNATVLPKWILDGAIYAEALSYCKTGQY